MSAFNLGDHVNYKRISWDHYVTLVIVEILDVSDRHDGESYKYIGVDFNDEIVDEVIKRKSFRIYKWLSIDITVVTTKV